ncbi:PIG-L deacetylase family protein [Actinomycetospora sp. TBRC 11914]|uniref:PIG-L deacetylase family protein n=1 Tax=Actinomycetospora sp. TBRC 11914 TaxID=2729387 RepID=UPI00145F8858|nr:PIG-L family deacetylase [Actinomycetospora sp. TBRC 11914]NMO88949.1 PIG-L family deacetylase [Actinomycetospora sp. TBRC 11914]
MTTAPAAPVITDPAELGTVLGIWAHPDDEAFLAGGLMAAARAAGSRVACITATLGEQGTDDPQRWPPRRLATVRRMELRASLAALDVTEHHLLGVADGGCAAESAAARVAQIGEIVDAVAPDTIVTFGPDGYTGHEDHQTVSAWAGAAREIAAPGARLLHATSTEEFVRRWSPARDAFDIFLADGLPLATPPSALAARFDLDPSLVEVKLVALRAQATQTRGLFAAVGEDRVREWFSTEAFVSGDTRDTGTAGWGTWRVAA